MAGAIGAEGLSQVDPSGPLRPCERVLPEHDVGLALADHLTSADECVERSGERDLDVGLAIVAGAAIGTLVFVITGNAAWIGLGAALGVSAAGVLGIVRKRREGNGAADT
jgi:hypothetical protein